MILVLRSLSISMATFTLAVVLLYGCGVEGDTPPNADSLLTRASRDGDPTRRPIRLYLAAEAMLAKGDTVRARDGFRDLVTWAATDPFRDGRGVNGCVGAALWRWLFLWEAEPSPGTDATSEMLDAAEYVLGSRSFFRMTSPALLGSLPRLKEDILRRIVAVSWRCGLKNRARQTLPAFLAVLSVPELSETVQAVLDDAVASGAVSRGEILLARGKRFQFLGKHAAAIGFLREAAETGSDSLRTEAELLLARSMRIAARPRAETLDILDGLIGDSDDPGIVQRAMLERAWTFHRAGKDRNDSRYRSELAAIADRFPTGSLADDALYELALYYKDRREDDTALRYFERLRAMTSGNDWLNLAHFQCFIAHYARGGDEDLREAADVLADLERLRPGGPMHLFALFWLGRLAEESGRTGEAEDYFRAVVGESPYDYFAVRARMHLAQGGKARTLVFPDSLTAEPLREAYLAALSPAKLRRDAVYHVMLGHGIASGLYRRVIETDRRLREAFPSQRLEDLTLGELDESRLFAGVVSLLSLRGAAYAAVEAMPDDDDNRLSVACAVGRRAGDWPVAIGLASSGDESPGRRRSIQKRPSFPAIAYPDIFRRSIMEHAAEFSVKPELLYAVMRRESLFHPSALSNRGAVGLFQFIPSTFKTLDRRWKLLASSGASSRLEYLLDPDLSIQLGARWFGDELLARQKGDILFAVMEHNAGYPAVRRWKERWKSEGRGDDIEFMIETIPYGQTRIFTRRVYTDMVIAGAAGFLTVQKDD
ncbi:MAG: transglycosylase SLT domain-containing protein [Candidatus Latescibacteria bacterium]|nr:transglycosylase SLT domain-containing protein [Candidatus Latescibacterota bacterium]